MSAHQPSAAAEAHLDPPAESSAVLPFLVVGVGASAGGLEAFKQLLHELPEDPGLALLYVQHLEAQSPSLLGEILGKATKLAVHQAQQGMPVHVNHLYVIPPDAIMELKGGRVALTPRQGRHAPFMAIDHLFRSLAEEQKSRAVGVLLSGGGSDGTLGFHAIKAEGGMTFAQDGKTAKHDSMPRSAVVDGSVDYVLPPGEIARKLAALVNHPYTAAADAPPALPDGEDSIDKVLAHLRSTSDVDFRRYKRTTITRRIRRRMALAGLETFADYLKRLEDNPNEAHALYQDLLIRVTRFFRDEDVFEALKKTVFPKLIDHRTTNAPIRLWVAGCSTGEEVYSLAMALLEFLGDQNRTLPIKILATDLNEAALDKARAGIYIDNIEADVAPDRLRRFFARINQHYQISKVVRDLCVFSRHNLAKDPPFSRLDLVTCRNVLIYLDSALQRRILPILHHSLNPDGYLVLGTSETIGPFADLFDAVDPKHRIYLKKGVGYAGHVMDFGAYGEAGAGQRLPGPIGTAPAAFGALDVQKEAERVLLAKYAPVGVVIDENMTVLHFRGRTGQYLEPAPGLANLDLFRMLREGLLGEVRAAIHQAKAENVSVRKEGVPVKEKDGYGLVNVEVVPIKAPSTGARCFLVLFDEPPAQAEKQPAAEAAGAVQQAVPVALEKRLQQLEQELSATRNYLQSLIEEHESACEELKSASEELLSSNEELQSTNEELQTAKEETQSANEELATLNEELQHRNVELDQLNNDLINFLGAVNIPLVLVNRDLRLRRFTPQAEKVLNLIASDIGRPITDIKPNINVPDLGEVITKVIDTLAPIESEIQDKAGHWYMMRIRPYITLENKIDGASLTLLDVDFLKRGKGSPQPKQG